MHGSRSESTIIDIHRDESRRTSNKSEVHPLSLRRYSEARSPLGNQDESHGNDTGRESESEHRDHLRMMIIQEVFRKIGRHTPCGSSTECIQSCEDLFLSVRSHGDTMWEGDEISSNQCKSDKNIGAFRNLFFSEDHRESYSKNGLEFLDENRDGERDESNCPECHREEECSDHS